MRKFWKWVFPWRRPATLAELLARGPKMRYDRDADVLYCSFGEPQEAISVETDAGIVIRHNPETNEVVGYTVVNFFKRG